MYVKEERIIRGVLKVGAAGAAAEAGPGGPVRLPLAYRVEGDYLRVNSRDSLQELIQQQGSYIYIGAVHLPMRAAEAPPSPALAPP